jgi:hypothetical protein
MGRHGLPGHPGIPVSIGKTTRLLDHISTIIILNVMLKVLFLFSID